MFSTTWTEEEAFGPEIDEILAPVAANARRVRALRSVFGESRVIVLSTESSVDSWLDAVNSTLGNFEIQLGNDYSHISSADVVVFDGDVERNESFYALVGRCGQSICTDFVSLDSPAN